MQPTNDALGLGLGLVSFLVLSSTAVYYFTPVSLESVSVSLLGKLLWNNKGNAL